MRMVRRSTHTSITVSARNIGHNNPAHPACGANSKAASIATALQTTKHKPRRKCALMAAKTTALEFQMADSTVTATKPLRTLGGRDCASTTSRG